MENHHLIVGFVRLINSEKIPNPRTREWPMMSTPLYPLLITGIYVYIAFYAIPKFMKNRRPYELKGFIISYNIYQVIACFWIGYGMFNCGREPGFNWLCEGIETSNNPKAVRIASLSWWLVLVKFSEFIETIVFALRKKHSQISFLHIYHHISSYLIMWICSKYFPGGSYIFPPMLNCGVHVIMYSYYLLTAYKAPWLQKRLLKFKPYITKIQMVQFTILLVFVAQGLRPSCKISKTINWIFIPNVVIVFYLFYRFYQEQYTGKNKTKSS